MPADLRESPERVSLQTERVKLQLRKMITAGDFPPGTKIAEVPVAERLGVSRTPVRLALGALEQEGLVEGAPRRGFTVRKISISEIIDAFQVRGCLEGFACSAAVESGISAETRSILERCLASGEEMLSKGHFDEADPKAWSEMNAEFHDAIVRAAHNAPLAQAIAFNNRLPLVAAGAIGFNSDIFDVSFHNMKDNQVEHRNIVEALCHGQAGRAEALMREHIYQARERLRKWLEALQARKESTGVLELRLAKSQPPAGPIGTR